MYVGFVIFMLCAFCSLSRLGFLKFIYKTILF